MTAPADTAADLRQQIAAIACDTLKSIPGSQLHADEQLLVDRLTAFVEMRVAELERALADVDMAFRLPDGGAWCATCRWPMREGTPAVKTLAVVCEPCATDLAATAGRLDPTRLAARQAAALGTEDAT